jgi:hypothetical protein
MREQIPWKALNKSSKPNKSLITLEAAIMAVMPKKTTLSILQRAAARDGRIIATDLEVTAISDPGYYVYPDGMYLPFPGEKLEPQPNYSLTDFPNIEGLNWAHYCLEFPESVNWRKLAGCLCHDLLRTALLGVHCRVSSGSFLLEATEGHILSRQTGRVDAPDCDFIIPSELVKIILRAEGHGPVKLLVGEQQASDSPDVMLAVKHVVGWQFIAKPIDATYPTTERVLPKEFRHSVMVSRSCLLGALAALRPYMANKGRMKTDMSTASQLRFIIRKSGEMIIVAKNTELDISKWARVECRYSKISLGSGEHKDIAQNTLSLIMPIRHVGEHIEEIQNEIRRFTLDINYLETLLLHEAGDTVTILYKDRCSPFALYFN